MVRSKIKSVICLVALLLAAGVVVGRKEKPQNEGQKTKNEGQRTEDGGRKTNSPSSEPRTLKEIAARGRGWGATQTQWYGKETPDFAVTDITGKQHKLSDYRGRNVIINIWATWCRPCHIEIPHLIELRETTGEDKLMILGISYIGPMNSAAIIKKFVETNPIINYPIIAADERDMPEPYNYVRSIPASFFIDPQGKIKLAAEGVMSLADTRAIIEAVR